MRLTLPTFLFTAAIVTWLAMPAFAQSPLEKRVPVVDRNAPHPAVSIGHRDNITDVLLTPDGAKVFTADIKQLRVWDVASRKELALIKVRKDEVFSTPWRAAFVPEKKWVLISSGDSYSITHYETLAHVTGGTLFGAVEVLWDSKNQRFYYLIQNGAIGEITEGKDGWKTTPMMSLEYKNGYQPRAIKMIPLSDGRLLVDIEKGHAIVDPVTWKEVLRVEDSRRILRGPAGTLLAVSSHEDKTKPVTVEKLSDTDLSSIATLSLPPGTYVYPCGPEAFDPETNTLCLPLGDSVAIVDFQTMKLRQSIQASEFLPKPAIASRVAYQPSSKEWFVTSGNRLHLVDLHAKRRLATFGDDVFQPRLLTAKPSGSEFLVGDNHQNVKRVRLTPAGLQVSDFNLVATAFLYTSDGSIAFGGNGTPAISVSEPATFPKVEYKLTTGNVGISSPRHLSTSADGSLVAVRAINSLAVVSTVDGKVVLETSLSNIYTGKEKGSVALSPDNRLLVAYSADGKIVGFDLKQKKQIWTQGAYGGRTGFFFISPEIFGCIAGHKIEYRSADTGDVMLETNYYTYLINQLPVCSVSPDGKRIALYDGFYVQVFDAEMGEKIMEQFSFAPVTDLEFLGGSRYIVTACEDNLLRIVDVDQRRELCSLALFSHSDDWVATAPDFRFDATEKAIDRMYVVSGATITPLESMFDRLYTPKLLNGLFAGEKNEKPVVNFAELSPPPSIRLEFSEQARNLIVEDDLPPNTVDRETVQIHANAQASRAALRELRIFQNGKLVSTAGVSGHSAKKSFELKLVPGENIFRAVAANTEGTESRPAEVIVTYRPKVAAVVAGAAPQPSGLQLHLLVVGVNTYKNPKYNLNYAVADATAVKEKIEAQTRTIFTGVNVKFILNDQALKSSIASAFTELSAKAGPRDVFVFYYAGHGVMTSDAKPEFFLVPHDVTQLYGADDALRQKGLSSAELQEFAKTMPAQKQLFILDACQSAGALTTVAMRGAAEEKAIAQLARSTGTHWLTASGSEQFATEFAQLATVHLPTPCSKVSPGAQTPATVASRSTSSKPS